MHGILQLLVVPLLLWNPGRLPDPVRVADEVSDSLSIVRSNRRRSLQRPYMLPPTLDRGA